VGLKKHEQVARVIQRAVHGVEQRQIALLGTTVNKALRKGVAAHHHCFRLTSRLWSWHLLEFMLKWLARK
jgi:hypothetical protein